MTAKGAASDTAVDPILAHQSSQLSGDGLRELQRFTSVFLRRVVPDELAMRSPAAWTSLVEASLAFARERVSGTAKVRVMNPAPAVTANKARTVVEVITDDMPFLVDSVGMAIARLGLRAHAIVHPVFRIVRDAKGRLVSFDGLDGDAGEPESVMHFEVDRVADAAAAEQLRETVAAALGDVRESVADWQAMRGRMLALADDLEKRKMPVDAAGVAEARDFLRWVAEDNFTFLGYREYSVVHADGDDVLQAVDGSGLGILRGSERSLAPRSLRTLVAAELPQSGSIGAIILTKTNARASVHRAGYMDYVGVLSFDAAGVPIGEQRFLGLFTSSAYMTRPQDVPLVRRKVATVLQRSGLRRDSHSGKALRNVLDLLPRDELFQCSDDELHDVSIGILALRQRPRPRLFVRRDKYGRFYSCLVYVPRDRFNTEIRERIEAMLNEALRGERSDSSVQIGESPLALVHLVVRPKPGDEANYAIADLEAGIAQIVRNWHEELREALVERYGEEAGLRLATTYGRSLPARYIEDVTPHYAAADIMLASGLRGADDIRLSLYRSQRRPDALHFKVFRECGDIALSEVLPLLENLGLRVLTEQLYEVKLEDGQLHIQDIIVQVVGRCDFEIDVIRALFEDAFEQIWRGTAENDAFNKLIIAAGLNWRQVSMLRGYCKYLLQTGVTFSQSYMEETLNRYPAIAGLLVELFEAGFDPRREVDEPALLEDARARLDRELHTLVPDPVLSAHPSLIEDLNAARDRPRAQQVDATIVAIKALLDNVTSLDDDRILRAFLGVIGATLRTNHFQDHDGRPAPYLSFKFDSARVPDLPKPRPYREIFVYSPRVEGVHLRFGAVARGGLRWSDRREDFRTEVLGLVKAQMVKNTVIVPVGSKGGFFVKHPPASGDREAVLAEGHRLLQDFHQRTARHHRQSRRGRHRAPARGRAPRRRRSLPRGRRRQGHRDVFRHRQRDQRRAWVLARRRLCIWRLGWLRPQAHGHHREGRMGIGQAPLPRARPRLPGAGLHLRRRRRHVGRRVRQRHAAVPPHPPGGRVRPPPHLPRPESRCGILVPRARAHVRAAAFVVGRTTTRR